MSGHDSHSAGPVDTVLGAVVSICIGIAIVGGLLKGCEGCTAAVVKPVDNYLFGKPEAVQATTTAVNDRIPVRITAYPAQEKYTDDTPCVGADGTNLCERREKGELLCATTFVRDANGDIHDFLPLQTPVVIPGIGTCLVVDRMSSQWKEPRIDVFCGPDPELKCVREVARKLKGSNEFITLSREKLERAWARQNARNAGRKG